MADDRLPVRRGRRAGSSRSPTTADLVVLGLLAERPMHGYQLLAEYDRQEVADWASVSKAQVYYALTKLRERGLLEERADDAAHAHARSVYAPTAAGREALERGLADPAWSRARVAQPFATWLGLSIHADPAAVVAMIGERRRFVRSELARERASLDFIAGLASDRARVGEAIVRLVIRQFEAELTWLDELAAQRVARGAKSHEP